MSSFPPASRPLPFFPSMPSSLQMRPRSNALRPNSCSPGQASLGWSSPKDTPGGLLSGVSGLGMALLYPDLITVPGDAAHPTWRATGMGVYRMWRDSGHGVGAILIGLSMDFVNAEVAFYIATARCNVSRWSQRGGNLRRVTRKRTRPRGNAPPEHPLRGILTPYFGGISKEPKCRKTSSDRMVSGFDGHAFSSWDRFIVFSHFRVPVS